jgi:integrase
MVGQNLNHVVRTTKLPSGERFALLYDRRTDLPLPWTTRYSAIFRRSKEGSVSTMVQELRAIAVAMQWAEGCGIDLDERIESATFLVPEEVLSLRDALRANLNSDKGVPINGMTHLTRCIFVLGYIRWRGQHILQRIPNNDSRFLPARLRLEEFCSSMMSMLPKPRSRGREGLSPEVEARLREVIHPDHPDNPFQMAHRHRNHALLLCYLNLGIRLSEALVLKGVDLQLNGNKPTLTIHRRPDDRDDPRRQQPLVKTQSRIIPLSDELHSALTAWVLTHRTDKSRYPDAKKTPYVFVSRNGPMAGRSVHDLFVRLRFAVEGLPQHLSAHLTRHTWNDSFSRLVDENGLKEEEEKRTRTYLMGWSKNSMQAVTYTRRHTREAAAKHSLELQVKSTQGKNR